MTTPARVCIRDFASHVGETITLRGWVTHCRLQGKICFLVVRDGTGNCQAVASVRDLPEEQFKAMSAAAQETRRPRGAAPIRPSGSGTRSTCSRSREEDP